MPTLAVLDGGSKYRTKKSNQKKPVRPHCKVSIEDVNWVRSQSPVVQQLWLDCIAAEQFGGAAHKLETSLSRNSFARASTLITGVGLFEFEEIRSKTKSGRSGLTGFRVKNLHGYFNKNYWEIFDNEHKMLECQNLTSENQNLTPDSQTVMPENQNLTPDSQKMMSGCQILTFSEAQKPPQQYFQNPNNVTNNELTPSQQPTKVVEEGVVDEEATAPLGGALPPPPPEPDQENQIELGATLKDVSPSPDLEPNPAPVALTPSEIAQMLDNATNGICPPLEAIPSLLNSIHGYTIMDHITRHPEWSINPALYSTLDRERKVNRELRQQRKLQLQKISLLPDKPSFEFLQECWLDLGLRLQIRQIVAKQQTWNISIVDEKLLEFSS